MNTVQELHRAARMLAQDAVVARERGNRSHARSLAAQALALEREAAELIEKTPASEPTRSILYLSAASLAFQAGEHAAAIQLANEGLSGFPPPRTAHDLSELIKRASSPPGGAARGPAGQHV